MEETDDNIVEAREGSSLGCFPDSNSETKVELKRKVGFIGGVNLIVATIIGSGIFISPKGVFRDAGSVGWGLMVWTACGVFSIFGALSYAELGTLIPKSGGEYPILLEAFGPIPAYLFVWTATIITKPAALSLLALTFANYIVAPFYGGCGDLPELPVKFVAAVLILMVIFVNCASVKAASKMISFFGFGKMISLCVVIIVGIVRLGQGYTKNLENTFESKTTPGVLEIILAFYQGLWAFDGWNQLNYVVEELKNPYKNLPRAIVTSLAIVTVLYLSTNVAYFTVLSYEGLLASPAVAVDFGIVTLGVMSWIIPVAVAASVTGTCLALCFTTGRISYVAARDGYFSLVLAMIHVKRFTPVPSVILNGVMALLMLIIGNFDKLLQYYSCANAAFYVLTCAALLRFRYTMPDAARPIKVPIILPILFMLFSLCLVFVPIIAKPEIQYVLALVSILFGLVFYFPFYHFKKKSQIIRNMSVFLQKLLMISYPEDYAK